MTRAFDATELDAVDELCRLALNARRLGCRLRLLDADPGLLELLELAGVGGILLCRDADDGGDECDDRDDRPEEVALP